MLKYALIKSFCEMKSAIEAATQELNNDDLKKEVNFRVGTFLHWLLDTYEYLEVSCKNPLNREEQAFQRITICKQQLKTLYNFVGF